MSDSITEAERSQKKMKECHKIPIGGGCCCCNCIYQVEIMKHPWNKGFAKGGVTETLGWGCNAHDPRVIFRSSKHGVCEMWMKTI